MYLVNGKIKQIYKTYALVETNLGLGICHISNFSDFKINNLNRFIALYHPTQFAVIKKHCVEKTHVLDLSFKAINRCFCVFKLHLQHDASGFNKLRKFVHYQALKKLKNKDCSNQENFINKEKAITNNTQDYITCEQNLETLNSKRW